MLETSATDSERENEEVSSSHSSEAQQERPEPPTVASVHEEPSDHVGEAAQPSHSAPVEEPDDEDEDNPVHLIDRHLRRCRRVGEGELMLQLVWRGKVRYGAKRQQVTKAGVGDSGDDAGEFEERAFETSLQTTKFSTRGLSRSPFLAKMLEGPWQGASQVEVSIRDEFTSLEAVNAALEFLVEGTVQGGDYDEFELLAAASLLQMSGLIDSIAAIITRALTIHSVIHAVEYGHKYGVVPLLQEAAHFLRAFIQSTGGRGTRNAKANALLLTGQPLRQDPEKTLDGRVVYHCLRRLRPEFFRAIVARSEAICAPFVRAKVNTVHHTTSLTPPRQAAYQLCVLRRDGDSFRL